MKEQLEKMGWTCVRCNCPGTKGYDCVKKEFRGIMVKVKSTGFRILKNGHIIDNGFSYQLEQKLKANGLA